MPLEVGGPRILLRGYGLFAVLILKGLVYDNLS